MRGDHLFKHPLSNRADPLPLRTAMKKKITGAKIACLDMNLQKQRMHLGVHITIDDPEQLEAIRRRRVLSCSGRLVWLRHRSFAENPRSCSSGSG